MSLKAFRSLSAKLLAFCLGIGAALFIVVALGMLAMRYIALRVP